jgi:SAM-dependent methyltransferase
MNFPESFDLNIYKSKNIDLQNMNSEQLITHYETYGKKEGRICSNIVNRYDLKSCITTNMLCLEIGPFDNPVLSGPNVKYFDVLDSNDLKSRALKINRINNLNNIPYIDYVNEYGDLSIIPELFDIVLSCHSIEHQPDFIEHLNNVSKLLKPKGYYIIICPDKRYCFDHFIKESTIADIIFMNKSKHQKHTIKSVIEHRVLTCHNDCIRHWNNDHGNQTIDENYSRLLDSIKEYENSTEYLDVHSLQFTPTSFNKIINLLNKNNFIDLKVHQIYNTLHNTNEFFVILQKN